MRLVTLFMILVSSSACAHRLPNWAPRPPAVWNCTYMPRFTKFRCTNSKTGVRENRTLSDARMDGAQVLSTADYLKAQNWIDDLIDAAEAHCR